MNQIIYKCGHIDPGYYREDIRPLKIIEAGTQNCWKCADAERAARGLIYDASKGSFTTKLTSRKMADNPSIPAGDYADNENVHDGNGLGE